MTGFLFYPKKYTKTLKKWLKQADRSPQHDIKQKEGDTIAED